MSSDVVAAQDVHRLANHERVKWAIAFLRRHDAHNMRNSFARTVIAVHGAAWATCGIPFQKQTPRDDLVRMLTTRVDMAKLLLKALVSECDEAKRPSDLTRRRRLRAEYLQELLTTFTDALRAAAKRAEGNCAKRVLLDTVPDVVHVHHFQILETTLS